MQHKGFRVRGLQGPTSPRAPGLGATAVSAVSDARRTAQRAVAHGSDRRDADAPLRGFVASSLRGFTLVELVIVITVIILILAIAVPGLSAMTAEARLTSAQQTIQGMTTQAYYLALANRAMTAVRFFPGEWDTVDPSQKRVPGGRQHLAIYSYVGTTQDGTLNFTERFERAKDLTSTTLPEDVWTAPLEALSVSAGPNWLTGPLCTTPDTFTFDPNTAGPNFLNTEDFLIVCDPQTGVRTGTPTPFRLRAYVPKFLDGSWGYDADNNGGVPYQRYSFSGVVTYRREPFTALGPIAPGDVRQRVLQESGRPFMVHRFSGGLLPGLQRPASP